MGSNRLLIYTDIIKGNNTYEIPNKTKSKRRIRKRTYTKEKENKTMKNTMMKKIAVAFAAATMAIAGTTIAASANETKYVANDIGVNVRQAPTADSTRLGGLYKGDAVDVVNVNNGWALINYGTGTAYVTDSALSYNKPVVQEYGYARGINAQGEFVSNNNGTPSYVKTNANQANKQQYTVKVDGYLALRSEPAFNNSNEIGQLHTGDVVNFKENYGTYWCVYVPATGMLGFVNSNYLV